MNNYFKGVINIYIRERIQFILAYLLALIGIGLVTIFACSTLELVPQHIQVDFGGFVFITSPILAIVSGVNFVMFSIFHKSDKCTSTVIKRFQIAFGLSVIPFILIIATIGLFGF